MRKSIWILRSSLAFSILWALLSCSSPSSSNNTDSRTTKKGLDGAKPKKGVTGVLVDQKKKPIANSMVLALLGGDGSQKVSAKLSGSTSVTGIVSDSVETDSSGRYAFETLTAGNYNLQGNFQNGTLVVMIRDIKYGGGDSLLEVPTDTLRAPGKISGRAILLEQDNGGIICYVPGTSFLALTDDSGAFVLSNIPQGKYTLAYRKEGWKTAKDTGVEVISAQTTALPTKNMEADPAFPPPSPSNLRVTYDTLSGVATLRWKPVSVSDLAGYLIYRNDTSQVDPQKLPNLLVKDTVYRDSFFTDFKSIYDLNKVYRIKSQDLEANVSTNFSKPATIKMPSPANVRTFISFKLLNTKGDTVSINDTASILTSYSNKNRKNQRIQYYIDNKDSVIQIRKDSSLSGIDTLKQSWKAPGKHTVLVSILDNGNSTWWDSIPIYIIQDPPATTIKGDSTIKMNSPITFTAQVVQKFGSIAWYKWGNGKSVGWDDSSSTMSQAAFTYQVPGTYRVRLYVRDDDGNVDSASKFISVFRDPPIVNAGKDTTVSINDTVFLHGTASDLGGKVVSMEWSIGGSAFTPTARKDTTINAPSIENLSYPIFFRATDDDGNTVTDTVIVRVEKDPPIAKITSPDSVRVDSLFTIQPVSSGPGKFGKLVKYEWSIGNTNSYVVSSGDTLIKAPHTNFSDLSIYLRVTDDDGNVSVDSNTIRFFKRWEYVGIQNLSGGVARGDYGAGRIFLEFSNDIPYVAYLDSTGKKATVKQFLGTSWTLVGSAGFTDSVRNYSFTVENGIPYFASATGNTIKVMKYSGATWNNLGGPTWAGSVDNNSIAMSSGVPYVAFSDRSGTQTNRISVMKYNGTTWDSVGARRSIPGYPDVQIKIINGIPYVASLDSGKVYVNKFTGGSWQPVGNFGFQGGSKIIYFDTLGDKPCVSKGETSSSLTKIMCYDGVNWISLVESGSNNFTGLGIYGEYNSNPEFIQLASSPNLEISVWYKKGVNWERMNTITKAGVTPYCMKFNKGIPYIYANTSTSGLSVMKYEF